MNTRRYISYVQFHKHFPPTQGLQACAHSALPTTHGLNQFCTQNIRTNTFPHAFSGYHTSSFSSSPSACGAKRTHSMLFKRWFVLPVNSRTITGRRVRFRVGRRRCIPASCPRQRRIFQLQVKTNSASVATVHARLFNNKYCSVFQAHISVLFCTFELAGYQDGF